MQLPVKSRGESPTLTRFRTNKSQKNENIDLRSGIITLIS